MRDDGVKITLQNGGEVEIYVGEKCVTMWLMHDADATQLHFDPAVADRIAEVLKACAVLARNQST